MEFKRRVLIVESWASVADVLEMVLRQENQAEVFKKACSGLDGLELFREFKPDIVVSALSLAEMNGADLIATVRRERPNTRVLVYTATANLELLRAAAEARPQGLVHKSEPLSELKKGVAATLRGAAYFSPVICRLLEEARCEAGLADALTAKERIVLTLIAESMNAKQIAERLSISPKTVENYRAQFGRKLGLRDVAALTRYAVRKGLVTVGLPSR